MPLSSAFCTVTVRSTVSIFSWRKLLHFPSAHLQPCSQLPSICIQIPDHEVGIKAGYTLAPLQTAFQAQSGPRVLNAMQDLCNTRQ